MLDYLWSGCRLLCTHRHHGTQTEHRGRLAGEQQGQRDWVVGAAPCILGPVWAKRTELWARPSVHTGSSCRAQFHTGSWCTFRCCVRVWGCPGTFIFTSIIPHDSNEGGLRNTKEQRVQNASPERDLGKLILILNIVLNLSKKGQNAWKQTLYY